MHVLHELQNLEKHREHPFISICNLTFEMISIGDYDTIKTKSSVYQKEYGATTFVLKSYVDVDINAMYELLKDIIPLEKPIEDNI